MRETIDRRLAIVCEHLRGLASDIEGKWRFGVVHLFVEEHVIEAHNNWRLEVPVPELDDYMRRSENGELVPMAVDPAETERLLKRIVTECAGVRGIASPCAPSPELLREIADLLDMKTDTRTNGG